MDTCSIEQGTVIYGIRSEKYPSVPCYAVIITARCDIAQKKVPKYYFLAAVDASEWFCTEHGYEVVYGATIKNLNKDIESKAKELELNGDVLLSLDDSDLQIVISGKREEYANNKRMLRKVESLVSQIANYYIFAGKNMSDTHRGEAIRSKRDIAREELKNIDKGRNNHYYYLPQHAYLGNSVYNKGLIVDLLEIGELPLGDADRITTPGIDFQVLPKLPTPEDLAEIIEYGSRQDIDRMYGRIRESLRLSKAYWLNNDSDYVTVEGTVASPWCEHLMQRFSNAFIRIGIDNPKSQDYEDVITRCYTGSVI